MVYGGFKVYLSGSKDIYEAMKDTYCVGGKRSFDAEFMSNVYEKPFEVVYCDAVPAEKSNPQAVGRHLGGCRIGFDAGGSDRKVSAVIDGEPVFSEEVVWYPKVTEDPDYHYEGIVSALKSAAAHMPRGGRGGRVLRRIYIENRTMVASLFLKVPKDLFDAKVKDIYIRAIRDTFGDVPYVVANDGDVSALAGAMSLEENNILGIAMGTSEGRGLRGRKRQHHRLAQRAGLRPRGCEPRRHGGRVVWRHRLRRQVLLPGRRDQAGPRCGHQPVRRPGPRPEAQGGSEADGEPRFPRRGHLPLHRRVPGPLPALYHHFYGFKHVLLLGRVMSGRGGDHHPGRVQAGAGRRVPRDRGQDQPHPARREGPPCGASPWPPPPCPS